MSKEIQKRQSLPFQMKPLAFEKMGEKLVRVSCYLLGTGINRNGSNITKKAIKKANEKLAHLPVVGHLIKDEDGSYYMGGHDIKVEDKGWDWEITPLTVPLGCVAGDKKFEFVKLEEDSGTTREYLKVDMIIWNHMSPVMEAAYSNDVYFSHSIEIDEVSGEWDETNNFRIDSFEYDKACLLGLSDEWKKNVEPCFPNSKVYPYSMQNGELDFNKQFALLLQEIHKCGIEPDASQNHKEEEDVQLGDILFSEVCAKINVLLADHVFRHRTGKQYEKYMVIAVSEADKAVIVVDREQSYSAFKIPYIATKTKEGLVVNIDYDNKAEQALGITDINKTGYVFNTAAEVEMISKDVSEYDVGVYSNIRINELMTKLEEVTAQFETAQTRVVELETHLEVFEKEKKQYIEQKHKEIIDTLIASRRDEMGKFSEYLDYCIEIDYTKTVEQIEKDIKEIHYNFMLSKNKQASGKKNFSAIETEVTDSIMQEGNSIAERYGEDIAKYFK